MAESSKPMPDPPKEVVEEVKSAAAAVSDAVSGASAGLADKVKAAGAPVETPVAEAAAKATEGEVEPGAKEKKEAEPAKPIDEGKLEHRGPMPMGLFKSKESFFWLGGDSFKKDDLAGYLAKGKEDAQHLVSWAAETGKGLFLYGEGKDKVHGIFSLADTSDPAKEGTNKFVLNSKGHKHTFKAPTAEDRDRWVATLKERISEAKELSKTVTASEAYKSTLESFKPAVVKKEEKKEDEHGKEESKEEAPASSSAAAAEESKAEGNEKKGDEAKAVAADDDERKEERAKADEKEKEKEKEPRSAGRKRTSVFAFLKSKDEKKEDDAVSADSKSGEAKATTEPAAQEPTEDVAGAAAPAAAAATEGSDVAKGEEAKPAEDAKEVKDAHTPLAKRASMFTGFFKRKVAETETKAEGGAKEAEAVAEAAPEIPPVEPTAPLTTDVSTPAAAPAGEAAADVGAANNGNAKKEMKNDKRKSSLPFFKKFEEKVERGEDDSARSKSPLFSKIRGTLKAKKMDRKEEGADEVKKEETLKEEEAGPSAKDAEPKKGEEEAKPVEETKKKEADPEPSKEQGAESEPKKEEATPVVAAAAW